MTKQTIELKRLFQRTAQSALRCTYGFAPSVLSDIEIFDGNGRSEFKIRVGSREYQFKANSSFSATSLDNLIVYIRVDSITMLN